VDDKVALVSSANLVTASFTSTGENGVVVTHPADINVLARVFTRLWQLSQWDMPPDARNPGVIDKRTPATRIQAPLAAAQGTGPVWTWEEEAADHHIARTIADVVSTARNDLVLATFSIAGISYELPRVRIRPDLLLEPVQRAAQRGARVRLLMRGRNFLPAARAEATAFAEAGAEIIPDQKNHAKGVLADRERGALFSANFTVPRGLTGGVEMGMRLDGTQALTEAYRYFEHVMDEANMEYLRDPLLGDLADTLYADSMTPWPLPRTLMVTAADDHWQSLAAGQGVVPYERASDGTTTLYSGRRAWTLQQAGGTWLLARMDENGTARRSAADIFEAWLTGKNTQGTQRGLCPATLIRATDRPSALGAAP
jgi:phosphatidylserine/phosphatidylglycerophosphate/cardiolipin synthase-like enzyme